MGPRLPSKASNLRAKAYGIDTGWAMGEGDRLESLEWYQEMLMAKVCPRILAWRTGEGPVAEHFYRKEMWRKRAESQDVKGSGNWSAFCLDK